MLARLQTFGRDVTSFVIIIAIVAMAAALMSFGRSICVAILGLIY